MSEAIYDIEEQWQAVEAGLLEGEQLVAVYDAKDAGTGFIGLTDLRVVLQDESYVGGRVALIPWVMFAVTAVLTGIGAVSPAACAIIGPIALGFAGRYGISPLMMGMFVAVA